jgi:hypothetical protein
MSPMSAKDRWRIHARLELALIFAVAGFSSLMAWELDHEVLSGLLAVAAGVAFAMTPSD